MITVIDLARPPAEPVAPALSLPAEIVLAHCSEPDALAQADGWLYRAAVTLVTFDSSDPRTVRVRDLDAALTMLTERVTCFPHSAQICLDVLRANASPASIEAGLTIESLAYSTLQGGPEFARWLAEQPPRERHTAADAVLLERPDTETARITFQRPEKHNAFSNALRAGLLDGLAVVAADERVATCLLRGAGRSFCSGGDLREFGLFDDVAAAHLARTRYSPATALEAVGRRLGVGLIAEVHGAVMGSGLEMAAYCRRVRSLPTATFGLPELSLGLIPGAGGTVSVTRRIGRWRTAYLVLSGETITAETAHDWGLVDEVVDAF